MLIHKMPAYDFIQPHIQDQHQTGQLGFHRQVGINQDIRQISVNLQVNGDLVVNGVVLENFQRVGDNPFMSRQSLHHIGGDGQPLETEIG